MREVTAKHGIVVADQEAGRYTIGIGRMPRDAEVCHAPRAQLNAEKYVDGPEEKVDHGQIVVRAFMLSKILKNVFDS